MSETNNTFVKTLNVVATSYFLGKNLAVDKALHRAATTAKKNLKHTQKRKIKSKAAADYALAFVNNPQNDLSELSALDLSEIAKDLRDAVKIKANPRHQEFAEALDKVQTLALIKTERHYAGRKNEPLPLYEAESYLFIISDYLKYGRIDLKQKKKAGWIARNLKRDIRSYNPAVREEPQQTVIEQSKESIRPLPEKPIEHKTAKPQQQTAELLEAACKQRKVRFVRVDHDSEPDIVYNFYGSKQRNEDKVIGSLTIHSATEMTLNSNDLKHFIVMAETARKSGSSVLRIGKLSSDEKEAKDFAARLVLAGVIAGIEVKQPYPLEELRDAHPKIALLIEKQQIRNEMNSVRQQWQEAKASGDAQRIAETEKVFQEKMADALQKHIHGESLTNKKTPEQKQKTAEEALAKTSEKNSQKVVNSAVLQKLQNGH